MRAVVRLSSAGLPAAVLCTALALLAGCAGSAEPPPQGVLLITVDTLRADHLGCYGAPDGSSPHIDRLAAEGVLFEDASTPVPITLPAHASLLTGVSPPIHGVRDNAEYRLGDALPTMAELLRQGGWESGAVVGAVVLSGIFGLDRGFSHYDDDIVVDAARGHESEYPERPAAAVVDQALEWLRDRPAGSRFFLWVHLFDPHAPYEPPAPFEGQGYPGEVAYTDSQVGRLLEGLDHQGVAENTLVILTADHGEGLGEHGEVTHGFFVYQSTMRVPLMARLPGRIPAGGRIATPVSLVDVLPTVLDATRLDHPQDLEGRSVWRAARHGREPEVRDQYLETYLPYFQMRWAGSRALRDGPWKLIDAPDPELYDLHRDPGETRNLAAQGKRRAALQARLEARARWMETLSVGAADAPAVDDSLRRQMRSLGYLAGEGGAAEDLHHLSRQRSDTKSKVHLVEAIQREVAAAIDAGDPQALARLSALAREDADNPRLLTLLGTARKRQGDDEGALNALVRAAELEPDDARAHANVSLMLSRLGRDQEASAALARAQATAGQDPQRRRFVASLLLDAGNPEAAADEFRALVEQNPDDLPAREGLGRALALQGRWQEALDALKPVLVRRPDAVELWVLAGESALRGGDAQAAERSLRRALELDPGRRDAQQLLEELR
jgi:arylsulfatase A-like enzyme/Flp pilus assembly protein TadD